MGTLSTFNPFLVDLTEPSVEEAVIYSYKKARRARGENGKDLVSSFLLHLVRCSRCDEDLPIGGLSQRFVFVFVVGRPFV